MKANKWYLPSTSNLVCVSAGSFSADYDDMINVYKMHINIMDTTHNTTTSNTKTHSTGHTSPVALQTILRTPFSEAASVWEGE